MTSPRPNAVQGQVRFGTAGWSFADWYGPFYPAPPDPDLAGPGSLFTGVLDAPPDPDVRLAKRNPLRYYARFFDAVEVNSSFYGIPSTKTTTSWADQTEPASGRPFLFSFKLPMQFSHDGLLDPPAVQKFRDALTPIAERGRLAAVLIQFPHSFGFGPRTTGRLQTLVETFGDLDLVVEVRHRSWSRPEGRALLTDLGVALANIDQPQDGRSTLAPASEVTLPRLAYVRLHGRNADAWFDKRAGRDDKYDYLYGPEELSEWAERVETLSTLAQTTLVIANNHFRGKAPANALELRALRQEPVVIPKPLAQTYPRLARLG